MNRWFSLGGKMVVYVILMKGIYDFVNLWKPINFTAQEENLVLKILKTHRLFRKSVVPGWNGEWWKNITVL